MYDELVKRLRDWPKICAQYDGSVDQLHDEAADAIEELSILAENGETTYDIMVRQTSYIEELQKKIPRWIPVTERPPKHGERVLVFGDITIGTNMVAKYVGYYDSWHKWDSKNHNCNPTHWMPLPEPPKEET